MKAGIDFSITSPAICIGDPETGDFTLHAFKQAKKHEGGDRIFLYDYPEWSTPEERFFKLASWAIKIISDFDCDEVNIEGYSMGSKGQVFHIGEATGLLKHFIWMRGILHSELPPTTVKKWATGKGNADKHDMAEKFISDHTGIDIFGHFGKEYSRDMKKIPSPISDMIDAYWMWKYHE